MTVKELVDRLNTYDKDKTVIVYVKHDDLFYAVMDIQDTDEEVEIMYG